MGFELLNNIYFSNINNVFSKFIKLDQSLITMLFICLNNS